MDVSTHTRSHSCKSKGCVLAVLTVFLVLFCAVGLIVAMKICCTRARHRAKDAVKSTVRRVVPGRAKSQEKDDDDQKMLTGFGPLAAPQPVYEYTKPSDSHYGPPRYDRYDRYDRYSRYSPYKPYPSQASAAINNSRAKPGLVPAKVSANAGRMLVSTLSHL